MISITNTKELHDCIQWLVSESDESLRTNLKEFDAIPEKVRSQYRDRNPNRYCVEAIWADALNIPDHLQVIAHAELARRSVNGPPLVFKNY